VRRVAALGLALLALAAAFAFRPTLTGGVDLRDFEAYYAAGVTWTAGGDPYSREIWQAERNLPGVLAARDELLPFVGPPFSLPLWAVLARLPYASACAVWRVVLGLAFATLVFGGLWLSSRGAGALEFGAALVFGIAFTPLTSGLALGQVAVVSSALALASLAALLQGRSLLAAFAALGAALQPNLGIALASNLPQRRAFYALGLAAAIAVGGSAIALASLGGLGHYLATLSEHVRAESGSAIQTSVAGVVAGFGAPSGPARSAGWLAAAAVVFGLAWQYRTGRFGQLERFALASAALPLALPFAHEHDFTLAFFPALLCVRRASGPARLLSTCAAIAIAIDWLGLAQRPAGCAQAACLALAAAFALRALASERSRLLDFVSLAFAPLVLAIGALAARHPLPVWPDALEPAFRAAANLDVSQVWGLEQAASGLLQPDALAAALRLCSLAGCALLWFVAARVLAREPASPPR
jgi:hypothetical protein